LTDGPLCRLLLAGAAFRVLGDLVDVVLADDETRERVFRGAAELGYRPDTAAQVLRRTRSRHLGVLFSLQQPYEVDLAEAIYPAAERRGYHVVLGAMTAGRDERQAVEELLSFRSEAIILIAPTSGREQLARLGQQIPLIEIGRRLTEDGGVGVDVVRVADERGAQQAVDHLVALGHRGIVHVDGARHPGASDRRRGYRQAMRRHHLQDLTTIRQDATQMAELAVEAAAQRLDEGRTTARGHRREADPHCPWLDRPSPPLTPIGSTAPTGPARRRTGMQGDQHRLILAGEGGDHRRDGEGLPGPAE
jgi:DNA-binding LacI/PurR family transcriptional regulator